VIAQRAPDDPTPGPLGYLVRIGSFATEAEANGVRDRLAAHGYTGLRVVYTGEDGRLTTGPWVVDVLEVDGSAFEGQVAPELGTGIVPELERLTSISARTHSLAAVNGGYFVIGAADGTPGDLAGISAVGGALVSEAVNGRTSLILPRAGRPTRIAALTTRDTVIAANGASRELDGLDRAPGLVRGCGGVGGDQPTEAPKHDFTCTDPSELIRYTRVFGDTTPTGTGVEAAVDQSGRVRELRSSRGGAIPAHGSVLAGTGDAADWLRSNARPGARLAVSLAVLADGSPLPLRAGLGIVNGGPRLLRDGRVAITAAAEGFHWPERPEFYYRFGVRRNPRTIAGVRADGTLLLATVDGRQPGWSVGASFAEEAAIMRALGAVDAVNLDGGGSTTMTIGAGLVNRPSDPTGERPIGDAIAILPED
jgi:Phosphodiester glycosidase/SPOR domain